MLIFWTGDLFYGPGLGHDKIPDPDSGKVNWNLGLMSISAELLSFFRHNMFLLKKYL